MVRMVSMIKQMEEGIDMTNVKLYHRRMSVQGCVVSLRMGHLFWLFAALFLQCFLHHRTVKSKMAKIEIIW